MARTMRAPPGAWQRAALVAVPLALVVLIFVTPGLIGTEHPQATDIPLLVVRVIGRPWNETVNETADLAALGALGPTLYTYLEIAAVDVGDANATSVANASYAHSLGLKVAVVDARTVNVTAMAVKDEATFRYNATVEFRWTAAGWLLIVQPEGSAASRESLIEFRAVMGREVGP